MYLKNDRITVTVGGVTMRSHKLGGTKEFLLDPTAVTGWTDGTNVKRNTTGRMNAHGDFSEKAKMAARLISFSGVAVASTITGLQEMRDSLVGILVNGSYSTLKVQTQASTRYSTVGLEGSTSWVQQSDTSALWKIDFYAPDPFIYGLERKITVGSSASANGGGLTYILTYPLNYNADPTLFQGGVVTNDGNAEAWPVFKVTGDYTEGFTLSDNDDHRITYTGMVTSSSPVIIDTAKGTATQGGVDRSTSLTERDWFSVSPKEILRPSFEPRKAGSGWCDIIIKDTWI